MVNFDEMMDFVNSDSKKAKELGESELDKLDGKEKKTSGHSTSNTGCVCPSGSSTGGSGNSGSSVTSTFTKIPDHINSNYKVKTTYINDYNFKGDLHPDSEEAQFKQIYTINNLGLPDKFYPSNPPGSQVLYPDMSDSGSINEEYDYSPSPTEIPCYNTDPGCLEEQTTYCPSGLKKTSNGSNCIFNKKNGYDLLLKSSNSNILLGGNSTRVGIDDTSGNSLNPLLDGHVTELFAPYTNSSNINNKYHKYTPHIKQLNKEIGNNNTLYVILIIVAIICLVLLAFPNSTK